MSPVLSRSRLTQVHGIEDLSGKCEDFKNATEVTQLGERERPPQFDSNVRSESAYQSPPSAPGSEEPRHPPRVRTERSTRKCPSGGRSARHTPAPGAAAPRASDLVGASAGPSSPCPSAGRARPPPLHPHRGAGSSSPKCTQCVGRSAS